MANPILRRRADKSVAKALREALKARKDQGKIPYIEVVKILDSASDGKRVSDVEYRDLMKILRTQKLWGLSVRSIQAYLSLFYPLKGPFVYPGKVESLEGTEPLGNGECAALVQHTIPDSKIGMAATWREGIPVKGNDHLIKKGTAVATFEDGFYPNRSHGNHVAYYISQDDKRVLVMDQFGGKATVSSRPMPLNKGRRGNGLWDDPSNNGNALSVIMRKA